MISVDTTFLVDLWRNKRDPAHRAVRLLERRAGETFCVAAHAAGEFLEGGACISKERLDESQRFVTIFCLLPIGLETARIYATTVAALRARGQLAGASKADLWIAAAALEHKSPLVTRNVRHFERVPGLEIVGY
jgi:tRNA(fMet)-specific endonuclease VapC